MNGPWDNYAPATPSANTQSPGPWNNYAPSAAAQPTKPTVQPPATPGPLFRGAPISQGPQKGLELGVMSDWDRASEALARGAGDIAHLAGDKTWMPGASLTAKDVAAEQAFKQEYMDQPGFSANQALGQIAGTLPTAAIGGEIPGTFGAISRALGAGGAGVETAQPGERSAATGALTSAALGSSIGAAGGLVKKWVTPEANRLMDAGIKLTPGQMRGGAPNSIEEKLSGVVPLTGDLIKRARDQSIHDWNTATLNKALAPIGEKITGNLKSGYEAVAETGDKLSAAYDKVLDNPNLKFVITKKYADDVDDINKEAKTLPQSLQDQFHEIINFSLNDPKISGYPTGRQFKTGLSTIGSYVRQYASSTLPEQRHMAGLLRDYQTALRDNLTRTNPDVSQKLKSIDNGWAQLVRIEHAAGSRIASDGVFSPSDLLRAERRSSNSVRNRTFSRGEGLLQSWARDGQKVLGNKIPDSGTAGRSLTERMFYGGAGLLAGKEVPDYAIPAAIGVGVSALPYTNLGISTINSLSNPRIRGAVSRALSSAGQYGAAPASGAIQSGSNQ